MELGLKNLFEMYGKIMIKDSRGISLAVCSAHFSEAVFLKVDYIVFFWDGDLEFLCMSW